MSGQYVKYTPTRSVTCPKCSAAVGHDCLNGGLCKARIIEAARVSREANAAVRRTL